MGKFSSSEARELQKSANSVDKYASYGEYSDSVIDFEDSCVKTINRNKQKGKKLPKFKD